MAACCQKALVPLLSVTFASWVISLGGLGSMQYLCVDPAVTFSNTAANAGWLAGVRGLSPTINSCTALFGYYWFMVAFEFAVITGLAYTIVGGCMAKMRLAWLSILAVVTVLYIQGADTFLTASGAKYYQSGLEMHTARGTAVGFIVTAVLDLCLIALIGSGEGNAEGCDAAGGKGAAGGRAADRV